MIIGDTNVLFLDVEPHSGSSAVNFTTDLPLQINGLDSGFLKVLPEVHFHFSDQLGEGMVDLEKTI